MTEFILWLVDYCIKGIIYMIWFFIGWYSYKFKIKETKQ